MNSLQAPRSLIPVASRAPPPPTSSDNSNGLVKPVAEAPSFTISNIHKIRQPSKIIKSNRPCTSLISRTISKSESTLNESDRMILNKKVKSIDQNKSTNSVNRLKEMIITQCTSNDENKSITKQSSMKLNTKIQTQPIRKLSSSINVISENDARKCDESNLKVNTNGKEQPKQQHVMEEHLYQQVDVVCESTNCETSNDEPIRSSVSTKQSASNNKSTITDVNGDDCQQWRQLEKKINDRDHKLDSLVDALSKKDQLIDRLYFEMDHMEQRIIQLTEEIYKRKQDMVEMSRKIIVLDRELKASHRQRGSYEFDRSSGSSCSGSRPFSQISYESCQSEKTLRTTTKWFKMSPLSRTFRISKRSKSKHKAISSSSNSIGGRKSDCVHELRTVLKEKDLIIADLQFETKLTTHRIEELENILRKRDEQNLAMQKKQDYLEKAIKTKLYD